MRLGKLVGCMLVKLLKNVRYVLHNYVNKCFISIQIQTYTGVSLIKLANFMTHCIAQRKPLELETVYLSRYKNTTSESKQLSPG